MYFDPYAMMNIVLDILSWLMVGSIIGFIVIVVLTKLPTHNGTD